MEISTSIRTIYGVRSVTLPQLIIILGCIQYSLYGFLGWANFTNFYSSHDGPALNPSIFFPYKWLNEQEKHLFVIISKILFEPICKHTEQKSRHRGLDEALVVYLPCCICAQRRGGTNFIWNSLFSCVPQCLAKQTSKHHQEVFTLGCFFALHFKLNR